MFDSALALDFDVNSNTVTFLSLCYYLSCTITINYEIYSSIFLVFYFSMTLAFSIDTSVYYYFTIFYIFIMLSIPLLTL